MKLDAGEQFPIVRLIVKLFPYHLLDLPEYAFDFRRIRAVRFEILYEYPPRYFAP
jgi:hypothetical protein